MLPVALRILMAAMSATIAPGGASAANASGAAFATNASGAAFATNASGAAFATNASGAAFAATHHRAHLYAGAPDPSGECEAAIAIEETRLSTPHGLLGAIAIVETGRPDARPGARRTANAGALRPWPWSVDVDGQGYVFADQAGVLARTRQALADGARSVDVGCMQVNLEAHPDAFATLDDAFDPKRNTRYAAHFLVDLWNGPAARVWPVAVGFYHSRNESRAAPYRGEVFANAPTGLSMAAMPPAATAPAVPVEDPAIASLRSAWAATREAGTSR